MECASLLALLLRKLASVTNGNRQWNNGDLTFAMIAVRTKRWQATALHIVDYARCAHEIKTST